MRVPQRRGELYRRLQQHHDNHLTPAAIIRLQKERERLLRERPLVIDDMQEAASQGDFSENAGYQAAKAKLRRLNDRVVWIEQQLASAIVIQGNDDGTVGIGSTITVMVDGTEKTFEILGSFESNPFNGKISHSSPLGAALLGKRTGDTVMVNEKTYRIIDVQ